MRFAHAGLQCCSTLLIAAALFVVGCDGNMGSLGDQVATSTDGGFQVTMPSGWSVQTKLNDQADIQVGNPRKERYLVVLSESKADFETPTIEWHSGVNRSAMLKGLTRGRITAGPKKLQINGRPAVQYEIRGVAEGIRLVYLHTTVDTGKHLHQVIAWTLSSKYEDNRAALESVINSFKATSQ